MSIESTLHMHTGCGAAWLARLSGGQEVGSSNLPSPTRFPGGFGPGGGPTGGPTVNLLLEAIRTYGVLGGARASSQDLYRGPVCAGANSGSTDMGSRTRGFHEKSVVSQDALRTDPDDPDPRQPIRIDECSRRDGNGEGASADASDGATGCCRRWRKMAVRSLRSPELSGPTPTPPRTRRHHATPATTRPVVEGSVLGLTKSARRASWVGQSS